MSNRELEQSFCRTYDARVTYSGEVARRFTSDPRFIPIDWESDSIEVQSVPILNIRMPEDRYRAMLEKEKMLKDMFASQAAEYKHPVDQFWDQCVHEMVVREEVPAVRAAYEKYQNLLRLVSSQYNV